MPKRNRKKNVPKEETTAATKASKDTKNDESKDPSGDDTKWEVVRTLDGTCGTTCRTDGCQTRAIVVWTPKSDPKDEWPMCEPCQESKVVHDSIAPSKQQKESEGKVGEIVEAFNTNDKKEQSNHVMEDETKNDGTNEEQPPAEDKKIEADTKPPANEKYRAEQTDTEDKSANDEAEDGKWHMTKIMSIANLKNEAPIKCDYEDCNLPAAVLYVSADKDDSEQWYTCLDCQEMDYGGWPDDLSELPLKHMSKEHKELLVAKCSRKVKIDMPNFEGDKGIETMHCERKEEQSPTKDHENLACAEPPANEEKKKQAEGADMVSDPAADEEDDGKWHMKKIMSIADLEAPIKCSYEDCPLPAAVLYVSAGKDSEKWYTCLDCQEKDYGGWPDDLNELPLKHMTQEHMDLLVAKCSRKNKIDMPIFDSGASPEKETTDNGILSNTITPPPNAGDTQVWAFHNKKNGKVTPSPGTALAKGKSKGSKPSKKLMEMHKQWQAQATAMGGPEARIVVSKPEAKNIIFDLLHDAFAPMNITQIHKTLKGVVPSPILKQCLEDMALDKMGNDFADTDDDEEAKKGAANKPKTADDLYASSLSFKAGKSSNTCLYYVDYSKLKNNGNGLDPHDRNELASEVAKAESEETALKTTLKQMTAETAKLLSEPTNEEATARLDTEEAALDELKKQVEEGRKLKVNEKHKQQTKRRIDNMATQWRKRRRICMDFLISMEENTDGTVSAKKCLAGDGQIEIDSDEAVVKASVEFGKKKRARPMGSKKASIMAKKRSKTEGSGVPPSESFVAVTLDTQGCVQRVHLDDEAN